MDAIQMEPVGKYKADRNGSAKGGAWRSMVDQELDDVAFLADSEKAREARGSRSGAGSGGAVAVCSQRRALCLAALVFSAMFGSALLVAYAGPQPECPCPGDVSLIPLIGPTLGAGSAGSGNNKERVAAGGGNFPWRGARLPAFAMPKHYQLWLHPNLTTGDLKGEVSIEFRVERETSFVVVNARDLNITERALYKSGGTNLGPKILKVLEYPQADQVYIEFKDKLRRRFNYTLSLRFNGRLEKNDRVRGFFLAGNHKARAAVSRFWLTHARSAFPCFDEPHFKASFKLTIVRDRFHVSLTNMPIVATEEAGFYLGHRLLQDEFAPSPPMSPHMVGVAVCTLRRLAAPMPTTVLPPTTTPIPTIASDSASPSSALPVEPPQISLYAERQSVLDEASQLLEWIGVTLQRFSWELDTPYPLPKLDVVVVEGGAPFAEGWGLLTLSPASLHDRELISRLLAQQWFGGLLSPRWWSSQWLMEALTSITAEAAGAGDSGPGAMEGERHSHALLLDHMLPALRLDAASGARAIASQRLDRADIEAATDELSLHKGAALVGMALQAAGASAGRAALAQLLQSHAYAVADARDLWRALEVTANLPAHAWETWAEQAGYPLVTATKRGDDMHVKQERFTMTAEPPDMELSLGTELYTRELKLDLELLIPEPENITEIFDSENSTTPFSFIPAPTQPPFKPKTKPTKSPPPPKWIIPLTFIVGPLEVVTPDEEQNVTTTVEPARWTENVTHLVWMNDTQMTIPGLGRHVWVRFNAGARGLYRTAWSRSPPATVATAATDVRDQAAELALRLDDAFVLSRAGKLDARHAIDAAASLGSEWSSHWAVWEVASSHLSSWRRILLSSAAAPRLKHALAALQPKAHEPYDQKDIDEGKVDREKLMLSGALLTTGVTWGNEDALRKAHKLFQNWMERNKTIPEVYQEAAWRAGVVRGDSRAWLRCWRALVAGSRPDAARALSAHDQRGLVAALAATTDDWLYDRFIWSLVDEWRRGSVVALSWSEAVGRAACEAGSGGRARTLVSRALRALPQQTTLRALRALAECLATPFDYYQLKYWYGNATWDGGVQPAEVTAALDTIALNVAWLRKAEPDLIDYFQQPTSELSKH